jgi:hypothetical protein
MKKNYFLAIAFVVFQFALGQTTTIAQWNFNGSATDAVPGGTSEPATSVGSGTASLVGGVTATFASGTASGGSSDPVATTPENYGWNISNWAPQDTENKQRGIQFQVSTTNFEGITFSFDQRLSNTAANTWTVQYSLDGTIWTDAQTFTFEPAPTGTGDIWYNNRTVDLTAISAINNQANVYFRIVAAFDPTTNNYRAARSTSTYGTTSTSRFDMVTVIAANTLSSQGFNKNTFVMYPNPAKDIVNFSETVTVELFDVTGKKVLHANQVNSIQLPALAKGIYMVKVNNSEVKKLVVN